MDTFSLLIIVKNRRDHLENVLHALPTSTYQPEEIIIVHMNEPIYNLDTNFKVQEIQLITDDDLPLAKARNAAAQVAHNDTLIFLDVDCIPDPNCFATLLHDRTYWQLSMVDPRYLAEKITSPTIDFKSLAIASKKNPTRTHIRYGASTAYEMFWSLGFMISKADFETIGGFDENYTGYGGEDTDFAFSAEQAGISFGFSKAIIYHQNHPSYDPPLNWLAGIVKNANHFYEKWHVWPMEGWLHTFTDLGYIEMTQQHIQLIKMPTEAEIQSYRKTTI